jgi:hypothetical protein
VAFHHFGFHFWHVLQPDATAVVTANGGKVLGAVRHPPNTADFGAFLLQAQASHAKVVGLANSGGDTINSIPQAPEFGITQKGQKLAALLFFISDVDAVGLPITRGLLLTKGFIGISTKRPAPGVHASPHAIVAACALLLGRCAGFVRTRSRGRLFRALRFYRHNSSQGPATRKQRPALVPRRLVDGPGSGRGPSKRAANREPLRLPNQPNPRPSGKPSRGRSERLFFASVPVPLPRHTFLVDPRTTTDGGWLAGPWAFLLRNRIAAKKQPLR